MLCSITQLCMLWQLPFIPFFMFLFSCALWHSTHLCSTPLSSAKVGWYFVMRALWAFSHMRKNESLLYCFHLLLAMLYWTYSFTLSSALHSFLYTSVLMCSLALAEQEQTTCHCSYHRDPAIILVSEALSSAPSHILMLLPHCILLVTLSHLVKYLGSHYFPWVWSCFTQHTADPLVLCWRGVYLTLWWTSHTCTSLVGYFCSLLQGTSHHCQTP